MHGAPNRLVDGAQGTDGQAIKSLGAQLVDNVVTDAEAGIFKEVRAADLSQF